jgi:hypothetical protein
MKNFLRGVGIGAIVAYIFHDDLDKALRQGLTKANEVVGESSTPPQTPTEGTPS